MVLFTALQVCKLILTVYVPWQLFLGHIIHLINLNSLNRELLGSHTSFLLHSGLCVIGQTGFYIGYFFLFPFCLGFFYTAMSLYIMFHLSFSLSSFAEEKHSKNWLRWLIRRAAHTFRNIYSLSISKSDSKTYICVCMRVNIQYFLPEKKWLVFLWDSRLRWSWSFIEGRWTRLV